MTKYSVDGFQRALMQAVGGLSRIPIELALFALEARLVRGINGTSASTSWMLKTGESAAPRVA